MEKLFSAIFILLCILSFKVSADEVKAQYYVENLLLLTGPQDFVTYIKNVQAKEDVNMANPFAPRVELSDEQVYYWVYFQGDEYLSGLKKQVYDSFTSKELGEIHKFYSNPFHAKFLIHFNTSASLVDLTNRIQPERLDEIKLNKDKEILTKNLMSVHLIQDLINTEKTQLEKEISRINQVYSVVKLSNNNNTERRLKNFTRYQENYESIVTNYIVDSFEDFRKSEMRHLVNIMKDKKNIQKYASIVISYHYLYLLKYKDIFKNKENLKRKLEEKENYRF